MDKPIDLVPLICLGCNTPVPAGLDEVAWVCDQCGQGLSLDEEKGLAPLEVNYSANITPDAMGKPYWVAEGQVILDRKTYGSSGKHGKQAERFWSQSHRFFVPAFTASLEVLLAQATNLLLQSPDLQPGPAVRFDPVTLSAEDVPPAAEFIVMAIEAGRKDKIKTVDFTLQLSTPVLWILP